MIFVINDKKKREIELPNPSSGQGVEQNHVGTQIKCLFTAYNENGGAQVFEMTALEFTYKHSKCTWTVSSENYSLQHI